ncbi:MAG TPA: hypothetical protein DEF21_17685 [Thalassospira lucentensis]|uniref:Uncharacterized protein n=2 Tax=Thalassospira lucentensis TaxID=168935 RepID=A0A358HX12_9PROT|nr:hypothetical protein [Thalassospira lucentensis]|tara:strand:+ start:196 stop:894 length:699 start_codon:yes stop_codon:yes gene_type:complete
MTSISGFMANRYATLSSNAGQRQSASQTSGNAAVSSQQAVSKETAAPAPGSLASAAMMARDKIDAGYAKLGITGTSGTTAEQWDAVGFPDLDRQMLFAVKSNAGGLFSEAEVSAAKTEFNNRISDIMDDNPDDPAQGYRDVIDFYDAASDDEKATFDWVVDRSEVQKSYFVHGGREDVGMGMPVVEKLMQAWGQLSAAGGNSNDLPNMPAYHEAMMWWAQDNGGAHHVDLLT